MPSDDNPIEALRHHFELEDSSASPATATLLNVLSTFAKKFPKLFDTVFGKIIGLVKGRLDADARERIAIMAETVANEVLKQDSRISEIDARLSAVEADVRSSAIADLLVDGARKAVITRSKERVRRIGRILVNTFTNPDPINEDEAEEMMRVATEVGDTDFRYLVALAKIEGVFIEEHGHVTRFDAHRLWEEGFWGTASGGESESVFRKLESYGLVATIPPPSNLTIQADIQTRFVLLAKGLRFVRLTTDG
jgi:hypothetical protein